MNHKFHIYMECSPELDKFQAAMAKAQQAFGPVTKDQKGPFGNFASLDMMIGATRPALTSQGLMIVQPPQPLIETQGKMLCVTHCGHASGQWMRSAVESLQEINPQKTLAYFSYMRRLSYGGLCCLASAEDNDGHNLQAEAVVGEPKAILLMRQSIANCSSAAEIKKIMSKLAEAKADNRYTDEQLTPLMTLAIEKNTQLATAKPKEKKNAK